MATFRANWAGTASTTLQNLMAGSKFEFLSRPAVVRVYGAADTATGSVQMDLTLGNVVVGDNLLVPLRTATLGPLRNEDLITKGIGRPGDRIQIRLQEIGAVNTPTRILVDIDDIA
jgi:hypothetical protein